MKSLWFFGFHDLMYYQWNILEFKYLFSLLAPDIKILCIATLIMNVSLFFINDPNIRASSLYNMVDSVVEIPHNLFVLILGHLLCLYLCLAGSKLYLYVCMCIYYVTVTKNSETIAKFEKIAKLQSNGGKPASIKTWHCSSSQSDHR